MILNDQSALRHHLELLYVLIDQEGEKIPIVPGEVHAAETALTVASRSTRFLVISGQVLRRRPVDHESATSLDKIAAFIKALFFPFMIFQCRNIHLSFYIKEKWIADISSFVEKTIRRNFSLAASDGMIQICNSSNHRFYQ